MITSNQKPALKDPSSLNRTGLAMLYNAARMVLFRPCLCPTKHRLHNQTKASQEFNQMAVENCVEAAKNIITILSWYADSPEHIFSIPPFWSTLHYLCQALAVLLLELALKCEHLPKEKQLLLAEVKKGVRWLVGMSEASISARKAWEIYDRLLHTIANVNNLPVHDMPTQAPVPPNYNFFRHAGLHRKQKELNTSPQSHATQGETRDMSFYEPRQQQNLTPNLFGESEYQFYTNPLDDAAALDRFLAIGGLHGQFDDPWQQHLMISDVTGMMQAAGQDVMGVNVGMPGMVAPNIGVNVSMPTQQDISPQATYAVPTYNSNIYPPGSQANY